MYFRVAVVPLVRANMWTFLSARRAFVFPSVTFLMNGLHVLVGGNRDVPAEVVECLDVAEMVLPAEVGVGVIGEDPAEQGVLHLARMVRGRLEGCEPAADRERDRLAEHVDEEPAFEAHAGILSRTSGGGRGELLVEELADPAAVLVAGDLGRLVVLGAVDDPELLRLAGLLEEAAGHVGLDVVVVAAVDHEDRPIAEPAEGGHQGRILDVCGRPRSA